MTRRVPIRQILRTPALRRELLAGAVQFLQAVERRDITRERALELGENMSDQKRVIILRGPSGAGKTTLLKERILHAGAQVVVCSADKFFEKTRSEGNTEVGFRDVPFYDFDVTKLPEAHQWCMGQFLEALMMGHPIVVVDNTNTRRWEYENYERAARIAGYDVEIIEIVPETIAELKMCAERNTHGVPANAVAAMVMRFEPDTRAQKFRPVKGS